MADPITSKTLRDIFNPPTAPSTPAAPLTPSAPSTPKGGSTFLEFQRTMEQQELGKTFSPIGATTLPSRQEWQRTREREELGPEVSRRFTTPLAPIQKAWMGVYDAPAAGLTQTELRRQRLALKTAEMLRNLKTGQPQLPSDAPREDISFGEGLPKTGRLAKGFFEGLKTGAESFVGDIATQFTGRGFTGDPVDFKFPTTREREDDILWVISGLEPEDIRDIAARTFPEDVPGQAVTDPVQLKEEAEQREAQKLLQQAIQMSKQPGSTEESIGQMLGGILTMGVGEEPITFRTMNDMNPLLAALLSFPLSGTVGVMPIFGGVAKPATSFAARQVTAGLSKQAQALTPLYVPELQRVTGRFMNLIGDLDPVMAGRVKSPTTPLPSTNIFGFAPIQPGLTRGESVMNLVRRVVRIPLDEELGTPVIRERLRVASRIESVSNAISQKYHARINDVFTFNKKNQIEELSGIDPALTIARAWKEPRKGIFAVTPEKTLVPTIQDVAARLPTYRPHLSDEQLKALRDLENDLRPFSKMLDEVGVEKGFRPDIMDGGFYVPRGRAIQEGLDSPIYVPPKIPVARAGRGPEKAIKYESAAEGIEAGSEYAAIGEVLQDYSTYVGQRSLELHVNNYLKGLRNADGRLIGLTPSMLIDPALRSQRQGLLSRIRGKNKTLIAQNARGNEMEREARRLGRKEELAGERVEATAERIAARDGQFLDEDLIFARREYQVAIEDAQALALQAGENFQRLRTSRTGLNQGERQLEKDVDALNDAIIQGKKSIEDELKARRDNPRAFAGGLKRTVGGHMKDANRLTTRVEKLSSRVERISTKVDDQIERGQLLRDMRANSRATLIEARQSERALMQKKLGLAALQRELRILKKEHDRTVRSAGQSGSRLLNSRLNEADTKKIIIRYQEELEKISGEWDAMVSKAGKLPEGYAHVNLAGMERRSFPEAMAAAINKVVRDEGAPAGKHAGSVRAGVAVNRLVQGLETTLDMSAIGIQGLVGMADNPRAWSEAVKLSFRAWGKDGERVLGRFLTQFDQAASDAGRLTSTDWAGTDLRIGGAAIGELQIETRGATAALGRVPGIKQANQAFGFFGDTLRLEWADDMLRNELSMGKTLEQLRRNGDLERIAEIANNMTGYSKGRAGGDLGELALFAPRFLQSRLTTVSRAATGLRPGASLDQRIARRSMLKMIGGAVAITHLINWMQGRETDMRPWVRGNPNSNFMRVRFGKRDFSMLGTWDSLAKSFMLTAMGRPQDVWRTLASPIVRIGWDISSGETAIGERTRGEAEGLAGLWSEETGYYAMKTLSPFAAQEIPEVVRATSEGEFLTAGVTLTGEIFGVKSGPMGYTDQFENMRRELYPDTPTNELDAPQKRRINATPEVQKEITEIEEKSGPIDMKQLMSTRFDDVARVKEDGEASLRKNIDVGMDGPDLRIKIRDFKQTRFERTNALLSNPDLQEELRERAADKPTRDLLAEAFWMADAPENPLTGDVDFDKRDAERDSILVLADQMKVERSYITGIGAPLDPVTGDPQGYRGKRYEDSVVREMIERFEADQDVIRPYLEAGRDLAEKRGLLDVYKEWRASNDPNFLKAHPVFKAVMGMADTIKSNMRRNDIDLERKLWKWGYIGVAENPLLQGEIMLLRRRQGGEITRRLDIEPEPALAVAP